MKKILFVLHLPPPVHGASVVGEAIRSSERVNGTFACRYVNLSTSASVADIGRLSLRKLKTLTGLYRSVDRELREFRPDLVYITPAARGMGFLKDYFLARRIRRKGFPLVAHYHNKGVAEATGPHWKAMYRDFFAGMRVILLSDALYPDIAQYVPRERVFVCPNGIPDMQVVPTREKNSVCHILYLSHLLVAKGIFDLLDACKMLKDSGFRFVLDIAGGPSGEISEARLQEEIAARGLSDATRCHGFLSGEEKDRIFSQADVFAFPTRNEAFGLVAVEAMAYGLPVVATREGGLVDIVADGETGYLVARQDAAALADAIGKLLSDKDLRERMGAAGRARFEQKFTREAFLDRFVEILQSL